ncbi:hypothetical protein RJ639_006332 [Escallonia herrerae]|uniref:Sulfotransferase n=1 Tax=Escallonia herrerae TaxID=1293975 RepID=A0AA89AV92_9ASTE|nr:hypothetical protein RJ639_006332 [Escallonia herrerae]
MRTWNEPKQFFFLRRRDEPPKKGVAELAKQQNVVYDGTNCLKENYSKASTAINASASKDDFEHCKSTVNRWASSSLHKGVKEDKHILLDLLFFLHVPRTGGRTFLNKLYSSSDECLRSYDKLRFDPSKSNCRLLHDVQASQRENSVVTILRNPIDRIFSTYEFLVEVAARFLVHPNLTSATRMAGRLRSKTGGVSTLDIWPWKYLVPWMREDLFSRVAETLGTVVKVRV